jgi:hypothetical protein
MICYCLWLYRLQSVGIFSPTVLKFHAKVLWLVGVKVYGDLLSNAMMWREVEMVTSKGEDSTRFWVYPFCCHSPPTVQSGCFYLNVCDRGFDSRVDACACLTSESDEKASYEDENGNCYNEK